MNLAHVLLAVVHALTGAIWLGAMCYSLLVVQPRAWAFFGPGRQFEEFVATVSQGARWKVIAVLAVLALSGAGLAVVRWHASALWLTLVAVKFGLLVMASGLLVDVSWRLWPARLFAADDEVPRIQRTFLRVGLVMIGLAALGLALGVAAHLC
jgi:hypothetical protein